MAASLELHVQGPGLDVVRALQAGEPELVLGRDADCGVCLPDPQRNVSRRHLSLWFEGGELHFKVLSVVNGIEMPFGEAPPGARGVLPMGQTLKVGDYSVSAQVIEAAADGAADPWAALEAEASALSDAHPAAPVPSARDVQAPAVEEDPFGDWDFEASSSPRAAGSAAQGADIGPLAAFFRGLDLARRERSHARAWRGRRPGAPRAHADLGDVAAS